jgi:aryl-alcohol dehydrogenase-like predicted oxidoreductase
MQFTGPGCWGAADDPEQAIDVLQEAVRAGVTHIDTADAYGPHTAEDHIRKALHPYPTGLVIATKGGLTRQGPAEWAPCGRPEYLRQCIEMSLRRLHLDCIDLYYLHRVDPTVALQDQLAVLAAAQAEGKIRRIGLSKVDVNTIRRASEFVEVAAVQNKYNIANQTFDDVLRHCELNNIAFVAYAPLASGRLVGTDSPLRNMAESFHTTPAQLALAWLLHRSPVITPIAGTSSAAHLRENLTAAEIQFGSDDLAAITESVRRTPRDETGHRARRSI